MTISYLIILGIIGCFSIGVNYGFAETFEVRILEGSSTQGCEKTDSCLNPSTLTIKEGDAVNWIREEDTSHFIQSYTGSQLNFATLDYSHTFKNVGVFTYEISEMPWIEGTITVKSKPDSQNQDIPSTSDQDTRNTKSSEKIITIQMIGPSTFYLDAPSQIIRASVEIQNFTPSDGTYFMKVTHLPTNKVLKDFEIYPKASGNDMWSVQVAYPILESDIKVGDQTLFGEFEIQIRTEKGSQTASTKFSILESTHEPESIPEVAEPIEPESIPEVAEPTPELVAVPTESIDKCSNADTYCYQKHPISGEAYNQCVRVVMNNCEIEKKEEIFTWAINIIPIVVVIAVIGVVIYTMKKKKGKNPSIPTNTKSPPKEESDDKMKWEGI